MKALRSSFTASSDRLQHVTTPFEPSRAEDLPSDLKLKLITRHESVIMTEHPTNPLPG
jgi:hypothetical protein